MGRKLGARGLAKLEDKTYYLNPTPCKHCGGYERYTSSGGCAVCHSKPKDSRQVMMKDLARENKIRAEVAGAVTFEGVPCCNCGSKTRYTAGGACVVCIKGRVKRVRDMRAEAWHSDNSPIVWVNQPPSPETAALYTMCPSLAAYAGQWTAVYSDAQHLSPGARIFPGCDVLKRPAALQMMLNDRNHPGHAIAIHLAPAYYAALRAYNDKVCKR